MSRIISIWHRVKATTDGQAKPTKIYVFENNQSQYLELETEDDELDFVRHYLQAEDKVVMILGGSGDSLAYALANKGRMIFPNAEVWRIPPFVFSKLGPSYEGAQEEVVKLALLFNNHPELFYLTRQRELDVIQVTELLKARTETMQARIACEQRLYQNAIGKIFRNREGYFPEGTIAEHFDLLKANDRILGVLLEEEKQRLKELTKACNQLDVYQLIFSEVSGCGPRIAAGIIAAVIDIRRFETKAKFRAYLGLGLRDGKFQKRKRGELANWNGDARQAFYLLGDQFNRRPDSYWGQKLREKKEYYLSIVDEDGTASYNRGHAQKMATWWTLGKFAEWLFREWWKLAE